MRRGVSIASVINARVDVMLHVNAISISALSAIPIVNEKWRVRSEFLLIPPQHTQSCHI